MKLIVALGNPGREYADTRHNAGFFVADRLVARHALAGPKARFRAGAYEGPIAGHKAMVLKPQVYMNHSGRTVGEAMGFYKLDPADLLVVVDDVALACGRLRLRGEGSAGGHNGLKDIERTLGSRAYPRLRLGIDPPGPVPQIDYVLGRFSPDQRPKIDAAADTACDIIETWLRDGLDQAMTRYNTRQRPDW